MNTDILAALDRRTARYAQGWNIQLSGDEAAEIVDECPDAGQLISDALEAQEEVRP